MKFLRHLAAVVLTVTVIVGLGLLWADAAGSAPVEEAFSRDSILRLRPFGRDLAELINVGVIQAAIAAVVIAVSAVRRRRRRRAARR